MIAQLKLHDHDDTAIATLEDDGNWTSPQPDFAEHLNLLYHPAISAELGDHHRPFGVAVAARAADSLGCELEILVPNKPLPDGVVS